MGLQSKLEDSMAMSIEYQADSPHQRCSTQVAHALGGEDDPARRGGEDEAVVEAPAKENDSATTTAKRPSPAKSPPRLLPQWRVLLHNDDVNDQVYVVETVLLLTPLKKQEAIRRMLEAHRRGIALLLTTHRERAELYAEQFRSRRLTLTIEPAD
jgi:ATP-dependent Clp protease adaptor protein ClpS